MLEVPPPAWRKTEKAQLELRSRRFGLSARARQLLILVDGRRRRDDLAHLVPAGELVELLALLQQGGFIEPAGTAPPSAACVPEPTPPDDAPSTLPLPVLRQRIAQALVETMGAPAEAFALRVQRCASVAELRALMPAAASVVEAAAGRDERARFVQRVGIV